MAEEHDPYEALRQPSYALLLGGSIATGLGTGVLNLAIGWEILQLTDRPAALGYVGLVQFLPVLFLSLPAGQAADRFSRKGLLVGAQSLLAVAVLALAALSSLEVPWLEAIGPTEFSRRVELIYACLLVVGIARAFSAPARWSLMPLVLPPEALANAVTWNSSGWQVASVAGPTIGGFVLYLTGGRTALAYLVTACCAMTCAVLVGFTRPRPKAPDPAARTLGSLLAGVRFVLNTRLILATITLDLFAVLLGGATALLPIFARDILEVGPQGLGWLRAAPALGALVMALALAHRPPLRRAGPALLWAVAGFGAATIVFGISRNFALSFIMLAVTGALDNISIVVRGTLVQVLTPESMRGRVSAVNALFIGSSNELGDFESGITAQWWGPVASVVVGGIGTIAVVLGVLLKWPEVARLGPLHLIEPAAAQNTEDMVGSEAVTEPAERGESAGERSSVPTV